MPTLPKKLECYSERIKKILSWVDGGIDQDEFDRLALTEDFDSLDGVHFYHGDTPMIGVFHPGQEWLELLEVLKGEQIVTATMIDGKVHYAIA
jgi:hypothetical protein